MSRCVICDFCQTAPSNSKVSKSPPNIAFVTLEEGKDICTECLDVVESITPLSLVIDLNVEQYKRGKINDA